MKRLFAMIAASVALLGLTGAAHAIIYLDDTWADGTRNNLNIPTDSPWFTSSSSNGPLSANVGSMLMRVTGGSSAMIVTYFTTNSTPPIQLNVGDTLTASFKLSFNGISTLLTNAQAFRIGLFNFAGSTDSRVTNDGSFSSSGLGDYTEGYALFGKVYTQLSDDTPIDIRKRTTVPDGNLMGSSGDWTSIGKDSLDTNVFYGFDNGTNYILQMAFYRTNLSTMAITMTWSNLSNGAALSDSTVDDSATNFAFDGIAYRPQNNVVAPMSNFFKEAKIVVTSAPIPPSIITQPQDQDVASGADVTFTAVVNGTLPLYYQWYYNTSTLVTNGIITFPPAHTPTANPTLVKSNAQTSAAGTYSVVVSNDYGSVTSSVATLLVADVPPGIAVQPTNVTVIPGQFATFSVMATGSMPLTYQWYYNDTAPLSGASATTASLTLSNVQPADAGNYSVIVSNPIDGVTSSNAVLTVDTSPSAPVFIWQPASITVRAGDSASLSGQAVGDQPISYQWSTNGVPIPGATSPTLDFPSAQLADAGTYLLLASNAVGTTASSNAILTVTSRTPPLPVIPATNFFVTDFGAYGDGISNNAAAIQATVSAAASVTGGVVVIPADGTLSTYMSGPIVLTDRIDLQIDSNATLKMLPRFATPTITNWPSASQPLIDIGGHHDVAITGSGTIDGNAGFGSSNWWQSPTLDESARPKLINIHNGSSNILVRGVTLQNSPVFHILCKGGNVGVTIDGVTWSTPGNSPNTDGMDLASTNMLIQNCTINVGDDNIEIGGSADAAADITISNCTFGTGHGVSVGSQVYGGGLGVHEVLVSNCWWSGTDNGIRLKSDRDGDGGLVQNLRYLDLSMTNVGYPIVIYSYYNQSFNNISPTAAAAKPITNDVIPATPIWRNVTISNLTATALTGSQIAGTIWGLPEMLVSNVTLYNVNISAPTKTFNIYNARGIRIIDSNLTAPNTTTNTLNLYNADVIVTNSAPNANLVTLGGLAKPGTNNSIAFVNAQAAITDPTMLGTGPITLANSTLTFTPASVNSSNTPITVTDASTVAFTSGNNTLNGALSGSGALTLSLPSSTVLTLQGDSSSYDGSLVVSNNGTLLVNNATGSGTGTGALTVQSTATLGGNGSIGGPVTVDGTVAPGTSPGTLTINNDLTVDSGAVLQYELGTSSDLLSVSGNLTLGGTLNVADSGGFTHNMAYTLFSYGGGLTYHGLTVNTTPNPAFNYTVDVGTPGIVKLDVYTPFEQWQVQYFGSTTNPAAGGDVDADGDGISNTNEFLAGTNPTNSRSGLRIISAVRQGANVVITWSTAGGRTNVVQAAAGGVNGSYSTNNFLDIAGSTTIIPGSGDATTNYIDVAGATNAPTRFYRIRLTP
ncbi:MAG TPA: glycosyl hydrolase family 28 protein [Verrucomicrobiae bacterium]|nr:glycosyl hydrolase family 28 protein [Verrucomicrobiae bacterium]